MLEICNICCVCVRMYIIVYNHTATKNVTASGVTLVIQQNTGQSNNNYAITLEEYSIDALKAAISGNENHHF